MFRKNISLRITVTLIFTVLFYLLPLAQGWDVPADKKEKNSYIKFDAASSNEGEAIYTKNCLSCHGNPTKNNSMKSLKPVPPDLSSVKTQALKDGELFYILNTGRGLMPSFKTVLSENERWKVIAYIRSFNKNYVQVLSKNDPTKSKLVKISMVYDSINGKLKVEVKANEKTGIVPLKDAEVLLFASRYFGKMQIDKTIRTDKDGIAVFNFSKDLPGDKSGNVDLIITVNDEVYGEIESLNKMKIGVPTDKPGLTEKRAIWNVNSKAPIWLIFLYLFGVLFVTACLLYIIYGLVKLRKIGNNNKKQMP